MSETPTVDVYDVDNDRVITVPVTDAVNNLLTYARSLGPGTPACGVWERRALDLATEHGLWPPKRSRKRPT